VGGVFAVPTTLFLDNHRRVDLPWGALAVSARTGPGCDREGTLFPPGSHRQSITRDSAVRWIRLVLGIPIGVLGRRRLRWMGRLSADGGRGHRSRDLDAIRRVAKVPAGAPAPTALRARERVGGTPAAGSAAGCSVLNGQWTPGTNLNRTHVINPHCVQPLGITWDAGLGATTS
jgi:hypothetical protein